MLWGTSSLALYIPWAGKAGPYLGISLWLWLGVLDAIQGVGLGMILLQVSSRQLCTKRSLFNMKIDSFPPSCLCDTSLRSGYWIYMCYGGSCHCTQRCWAWFCFPGRSKVGLRSRAKRFFFFSIPGLFRRISHGIS